MPIAIMNGVGIYDLKNRKYLEIVDISKVAEQQTLEILNQFELSNSLSIKR